MTPPNYIGPRGGRVRSAMAGVLGLDEDLHRRVTPGGDHVQRGTRAKA